MTTILRIFDQAGQRDFTEADFPVAIAASAEGCLIFGGEVESNPVAWLGLDGGHVFIQPEGGVATTCLNGALLAASAWLTADDELKIGETVLAVSVDSGTLILKEVAQQEGALLRPPEAPPPLVEQHNNNDPAPAAATQPATPLIAPLPIPKYHSRWRRMMLVLFMVLVLCVIFVLAAVPVQLTVDPMPDALSLDGFPQPVKVGERYLTWPGDYKVVAEKAGYRKLEEPMAVTFGTEPVFTYQMRKLPGLLTVVSQPVSNAEVMIGDRAMGRTPLESLELEAGTHGLLVKAERYLPDVRTIEIQGMGQSQTIEALLKPGWGTLSVNSDPDGADVSVDGIAIGQTPLQTEPMEGSHKIELHKTGWKPVSNELVIKAGETIELPIVRLEKIDGILELTTKPPGATVLLNGEFRGHTPLSLPLVVDREHRLNLSKSGYVTQTQTVRLEGGEPQALEIGLKPEYGTVFISSQPANAQLVIDGKLKGFATGRFRLTTRAHKIEIKKAGYETFTTTLTPSASVSKKLDVRLSDARVVKKKRIKAVSPDLKTAAGQVMQIVRLNGPAQIQMGASRREAGRRANENLYSVELTRSYYISEKEVTNAEFRTFRKEHIGASSEPDHPVTLVSWDDAARYLNWLSKKEGLPPAYREENGSMRPVVPVTMGYRLPTEAEWAFAARYEGGRRGVDKPLKYPWEGGLPPPLKSGNYADRSAVGRLPITLEEYSDGFQSVAPVGQFLPNRAGLYDLGGNVAEWCHDYYDVRPGGNGRLLRDPTGPADGRYHVIRGSSWRHGSITELRLSYRDYAEKPRDDLGFRIARYVQEAEK